MLSDCDLKHGRKSPLVAAIALRLYAMRSAERSRVVLRKWIVKLEGGPAYSLTIRELFERFHAVKVGVYTANPCAVSPRLFHRGTTFGRYSYIADTVRTFTRNHTTSTLSTHGFF